MIQNLFLEGKSLNEREEWGGSACWKKRKYVV